MMMLGSPEKSLKDSLFQFRKDNMQKLPFDLKVGDYCYGYVKGIHKVEHILFPAEGKASCALVTLKAVLDSSYRPRSGTSTCDVAWCRKVTREELLAKVKDQYTVWEENINKCLSA